MVFLNMTFLTDLLVFIAYTGVNLTDGFPNLTRPTTFKLSNTTTSNTSSVCCQDSKSSASTIVSNTTIDRNNRKNATCNVTTEIVQAEGRIVSVNFPEPYYTNCEWTYTIDVGTGYNTNIQIEQLDIDREAGDRFTVEPTCVRPNYRYQASTKSSDTNSSNVYRLRHPCSTTMVNFKAIGRLNNNHTGFKLLYSRYGESDYYVMRVPGWVQMYLQGVSVDKFHQKKDYFKLGVQKATENFFQKHHINISKFELQDSVLVNSVIGCPKLWPQSFRCVQVNFSVVLNHKDVNSTQLNEIRKSSFFLGELDKLGISEYQVPNYVAIMWFWIALLVALIFIFVLIALLLTKTKVIGLYFQRLSDVNIKDATYRDCLNIQENLAAQIFSAENSHKYRFIRDCEKGSRFGKMETKCSYNNSGDNSIRKSPTSMSVIMEEIDDFDSDNDEMATGCEASHFNESSFSKANTCYHMYAEPNNNNNNSNNNNYYHHHHDGLNIERQKYEPISIIKL